MTAKLLIREEDLELLKEGQNIKLSEVGGGIHDGKSFREYKITSFQNHTSRSWEVVVYQEPEQPQATVGESGQLELNLFEGLA